MVFLSVTLSTESGISLVFILTISQSSPNLNVPSNNLPINNQHWKCYFDSTFSDIGISVVSSGYTNNISTLDYLNTCLPILSQLGISNFFLCVTVMISHTFKTDCVTLKDRQDIIEYIEALMKEYAKQKNT